MPKKEQKKPREDVATQRQKRSQEYFTNESSRSEKAITDDARKFVAKGSKLIYSNQGTDAIVQALQGPNPVEAIASITLSVVKRVEQAIEQSGAQVEDPVKAVAAASLMGQILEIGEASGVAFLDDGEKEVAFTDMVNRYIQDEINAGRIDREKLAESAGRGVSKMDDEEMSTLDEQLKRIDSNAQLVQQRYSPRAQAPQQQPTSLLEQEGV
jgi:hypothetical protein